MIFKPKGVSFAGLADLQHREGLVPFDIEGATVDLSNPKEIVAAVKMLDSRIDSYVKQLGGDPKVIQAANRLKKQYRQIILDAINECLPGSLPIECGFNGTPAKPTRIYLNAEISPPTILPTE